MLNVILTLAVQIFLIHYAFNEILQIMRIDFYGLLFLFEEFFGSGFNICRNYFLCVCVT